MRIEQSLVRGKKPSRREYWTADIRDLTWRSIRNPAGDALVGCLVCVAETRLQTSLHPYSRSRTAKRNITVSKRIETWPLSALFLIWLKTQTQQND
jgi:hypothetical protein